MKFKMQSVKMYSTIGGLMEDGSLSALADSIEHQIKHLDFYEIQVQYRNLTFWNLVTSKSISSVASTMRTLFLGGGKKHRVNIINDLTGRILSKTMTLVIGPPGCGGFSWRY